MITNLNDINNMTKEGSIQQLIYTLNKVKFSETNVVILFTKRFQNLKAGCTKDCDHFSCNNNIKNLTIK